MLILRVDMTRLNERIENFNKAFTLFAEMRNSYLLNKTSDLARLALVQSFEIVFELSWKVLKDYLAANGIEVFTPKEVIKEAFSAEKIQNGQIWIDMLKDRNSSSHEYNMDKVSVILERISTIYYDELSCFKKQIKDFHG